MHLPAPHPTIDRHGNLCLRRRMIDRVVEDEEIRTEVPDAEGMAVDMQMHMHVGGVALILLRGAHDFQR